MILISVPDVISVRASVKTAAGDLLNLIAAVGAFSPGSLSGKNFLIKVAVSELTGCDYCVGVSGMLPKIVGLSANAL